MRQYPYLRDVDFLMQFSEIPIKEQFVKITVLNFQDRPIKSIEGQVESGSININGSSSVRRTANLNVIVEEKDASFMKVGGLFSMNKKVKIEIGLTNNSNRYKEFPILWFPQGVFVIMGISLSHSTAGLSVSLDLKDKMVLLNGECGGIIGASTVFHEYEVLNPETGDFIVEKPTIVQIIRELVNHFGGEQIGKILISDIDTRVKKVMKWTKSYPLYRQFKDNQYIFKTELSEDENEVDFYKIGYGEDIGFIYSDFYYPGELAADAGSSVCDVLDTIKGALGNFEYFYDIDGNFIFQEIKNYLNTSKVTLDIRNMQQNSLPDTISPQNYIVDKGKGNAVYVFNNSKIITSYSSSPQYNMVKNDFIVWGERKVGKNKLPIRYHLAIDKKPTPGNVYSCFRIETQDALGESHYSYIKGTPFKNATYFPEIGEEGRVYTQTDDTSKYYIWKTGEAREILDTEKYKPPTFDDDKKYTYYHRSDVKLVNIKTTDWRSELFMQGVMGTRHGTDSNYYFTELLNEWPKLYDLGQWNSKEQKFIEEPGFKKDLDYSGIDFYLDFIDSDAAISEFNINNIGRRTKIINDSKINCIFETDIPDVVLLNQGWNEAELNAARKECQARNQNYSQISEEIFESLAQGGSQNSAYNEIRNLLYQHTQYNEGVSVQLLPMYFLEPNIRITLKDEMTGINGDYMINSISVPLDINGTTSLSCSKVAVQI